jgi:hypothetical protein
MDRRTFTTNALLFSAVVFGTTLPQPGFTQGTPLIGTWKLNLEKSKYSPGPAPKSGTTTFEVAGLGLRITAEGIDAQGKPTKTDFGEILFDGKSYPVTGAPAYDASSYKLVNASTFEYTRTKAGKVVQTATSVVSADGKTRTLTTIGVDEKGQQINNVAVYDKQ